MALRRRKSSLTRKRARQVEPSDDSPVKSRRSENGTSQVSNSPSESLQQEEEENNNENNPPSPSSPPPPPPQATTRNVDPTYHLSQLPLNVEGRPPEVGVIQKIYVENFMCHRKFELVLCRNVNFIHGQNGSGKSAILAAIQICLGAGARRTNRARNLKELVRKDTNCSCAKVRVTLLNRGEDGYKHDIYGDSITVERTIALRGGYNGYKLLDENMKEQSRQKCDLDEMLDKLNIQVENPVAILDQEEAKKFLSCKGEDKYAFFLKATDLERMDRTYANCLDQVAEQEEQKIRLNNALSSDVDTLEKAKAEWRKHEELKKLKNKLDHLYEGYAWAMYNIAKNQYEVEAKQMEQIRERTEKRQQELQKAEEALSGPNDEELIQRAKLDDLIDEVQKQAAMKQEMEAELKRANEPQRARERQVQNLRKQQGAEAKNLHKAKNRLEAKRNEILAKEGSAESEEAKRTEQLRVAEEELTAAREKQTELKQAVSNAYRAYEEVEPHLMQAKQNCSVASAKLNAIENKIRSLQNSSSGSLAMFGPRCNKVKQMVDDWQRKRLFTGPVVGPIGSYLNIAPGKEDFASLAELALGFGNFDRFIVTNNSDRKKFQQLRKEAGCLHDCGVFQVHQSPRYNVPAPPVEGIETIASALNFSDDLVFNCLVDNCRIDERALARSKEESERLLLMTSSNNRYMIRGKLKEVFCLPSGDHWSVRDGSIAIVGNEKKMRQSIGVDKSVALAEAKNEAVTVQNELRELRQEESKLEHNHTDHQREWNHKKRESQKNNKEIDMLLSRIDQIKAEKDSAANFDTDTSEYEQEVTELEQNLEDLKAQESKIMDEIEHCKPGIQEIRSKLEEVKHRNEKVLADMRDVEKEIERFVDNSSQRQEKLEKKRNKVRQYREIMHRQEEKLNEISRDVEKNLKRAKKQTYISIQKEAAEEEGATTTQDTEFTSDPTDEELEKIEVKIEDKDPKWFESRITRAKDRIEKERQRQQMSNDDPAAVYQKYIRAQQLLDGKVEQIKGIEETTERLKRDMKSRKRRWMQFRDLIQKNTDQKFDEILNLRGSSGELEFDDKSKTLSLVVQKDSADANSQQKDVNALSGGERSFTTIALLLALGETLETPFRILDEFDVFLDPMSRKLVLETLIEVGQQMKHRQFIFITPQDLSNITPNPMLRILKLQPPERTNMAGLLSQQTLEFSQSG